MQRRLPGSVVLLALICTSPKVWCQAGQPSDAILRIVASRQYDLADSGRVFLLEEARRSDYFLLGELHGDNEIPQLIRRLWAELWKAGYHHVAAEVSSWTAERLQAPAASGEPPIQGLWTRRQAEDVHSPAPEGAEVLWGCDMEEMHPEYLIRDLFRLNPTDPGLRKMVALTNDGYKRTMAEELSDLLSGTTADRDVSVNGISLRRSLTATLEIEKHRANPVSKMTAQNERELLMKMQFLEHLRTAPDSHSKVLLRFGRNHLHRGYDARGISTLGNFVTEFAISQGQSVFNAGAFGAGGQATLMGETFSADERSDEPAFALLAERARYDATVYDLRPLRPLLHAIPADKRSSLESNLTYWADAYDALICYKTVTPLKE